MLALALAVGCSLAIGMIFKHAGQRGLDRLTLLTVNYAAAFALAAVLLMLGTQAGATPGEGLRLAPGLLVLGVTTGALFIFGFFMLSLATDVAGMSLAIGVMRISVVIPFLASWVIWDEVPSVAQGAGLVVAGAAFFMIARREEAQPARAAVAEAQPAPAAAGAAAGSAAAEAERRDRPGAGAARACWLCWRCSSSPAGSWTC